MLIVEQWACLSWVSIVWFPEFIIIDMKIRYQKSSTNFPFPYLYCSNMETSTISLFFSLLFYSLKDFVNNASVAWVLSPLNLRSSAMTCTLLNPRDSISFTVSSVNGSWGKTVVSMEPSLLDVPLELLFSCASKIHSIHLKKSLYSSKSQIKL